MIFERLIRNTLRLARLEAGFFVRYPKLLLGGLVVALIPALYVLIYLSSVWDPASKTGDLPVAIVNLDRGLEYRGQHSMWVGMWPDACAPSRRLATWISPMNPRQGIWCAGVCWRLP